MKALLTLKNFIGLIGLMLLAISLPAADMLPAEVAIFFGAPVGTALACVPIVSLNEICGPNFGGTVDEVWVIRKSDVGSFGTSVTGVVITGDIVPKSGVGWAKWAIETQTGKLNWKTTGDAGNKCWDNSINARIPRMNSAILNAFNSSLNAGLIVALKDKAGQVWVMGDLNNGVYVDYDYTSGEKATDKNGTAIVFAAAGKPAYAYAGVLSETPTA